MTDSEIEIYILFLNHRLRQVDKVLHGLDY